MGQASQETGIFPWMKGADFSGPLAVLGLLPAKIVVPSIGAIFMLYARETMTGPSLPSLFLEKAWWGNPWGFESPLRHHANYKRDFGLPPESLFSQKRAYWLISGSRGDGP